MKTLSIITPMLNCMRTIEEYFSAILMQDYPHELIEIIVADAGSTDGTLAKLEEFSKEQDIKLKVVENPLKTAEAGKAAALKHAENEIVLLLDSDNIIPSKKWLKRMLAPFEEANIVASEPIRYTYRKTDGIINRYCALIGMNDPLCMFTGNYDRFCCITGRWTEIDHECIDRGDYLSLRFPKLIPTIGANGFLMRRKELAENVDGDYLFDIDVLWTLFQKDNSLRVAKVKTGIVHLFCPDLATFKRKQNRRITDYLYFSEAKGRKYPWGKTGRLKLLIFILDCVLITPLIVQAINGYRQKKDAAAWLLHPLMCWITLWEYGMGTIKGLFHKEAADRSAWKQ